MFQDPGSTFLILVVLFIAQLIAVVLVHDLVGTDDDDIG
jgi:hypothetical protein